MDFFLFFLKQLASTMPVQDVEFIVKLVIFVIVYYIGYSIYRLPKRNR